MNVEKAKQSLIYAADDINNESYCDALSHINEAFEELVTQWQPIETAPLDGSWFQAYDKKSEWRTGVPSVCVVYVNKDGKFTDINNTNRANLTHWQPLPQPPKQ